MRQVKPYFTDSTGTITKTCSKCGWAGPLDGFHLDKRSSDGHVADCKRCARERARKCREAKIEYWRALDRERAKTPERKAQDKKNLRKKRARNPLRSLAHSAVSNALRAGRLKKCPCEVCGLEEVDAHHDDYSKPLDVRWLCRTHHCEHHAREIAAKRLAQEVLPFGEPR